MKYLLPLLALVVFAAPGVFAQGTYTNEYSPDHVNLGIFGNFFRLNDGNINFEGFGARFGANATPYVQIEVESSYDFTRSYTQEYSNGGSVQFATSNLRILHVMAGPKVQTNRGHVRLFLTAKGGFDDFMFSNAPVTFGTVGGVFGNLRANNLDAVFYPGVGGEAFWGPIGLRLDAGDEIYFTNGPHNNLRLSFGPSIRF